MGASVPDDFWVEWHPTRSMLLDVASFEWQRLDAPIRELSCSHGFERTVARVETGSALVVFDNRNRQLDPTNRHSPLYPNVAPFRHVRIRARVGATTLTIWRGFSVNFSPFWSENDGWAVLDAKDTLFAAAKAVRESTFTVAVAALAPDLWLPLDDGGTATAQGRDAGGQNASMTATASAANLLPFGNQPSTTFPFAGSSKGDVIVNSPPYAVNPAGFTVMALFQAQSPAAQVLFAAGPTPPDPACPSGDVALTVDVGDTYSLRVGNAGGSSLLSFDRPHADPSSLVVARYTAAHTTLDVSLGYGIISGNTVANAGIGGTHAPRAGHVRVGAGLDTANANPLLGSLAHVAQWQRELTDNEMLGLYNGFFGSVTNTALTGSVAKTTDVVGWVLDRLGVPGSRRDLSAGVVYVGATPNDLVAVEMMARAAATEGGYFFADRQGNYVFRLAGAVGNNLGTYDTRPQSPAVMRPNDSGLEIDVNGWAEYPTTVKARDTSQHSAGVASLALSRRDASFSDVTATVLENEWTEAQSTLEDGTVGPWVARADCSISNPMTGGRDGSGFLRIQAVTGGDCHVDGEGARVPAVPDLAVQAVGYLQGPTIRTARLYIDWYDVNGVLITTTLGPTSVVGVSPTAWTELVIRTLPPATAKFRRVGAQVIGPTVVGEVWKLDDVMTGPVGFVCLPGQVLTVAAKVKTSVAGKTAGAGAVFFDANGVSTGSGAPTVTTTSTGFTAIATSLTVPAGTAYFAPAVTCSPMVPGETAWFDEIDVRPAAGAALADITYAHDDRTFFTVARFQVTTAAQPQVVEYRHPNADVYGDVVYAPPTQFHDLANAQLHATAAVGDATPKIDVTEAEVVMGAAGVDPLQLLSSTVLDQAGIVARIPGDVGWTWSVADAFTGVSPASLGTTPGGTGVTDVAVWTPRGADTWGKDAGGAYRNGAIGHQQVTLNAGVPDQVVAADLSRNGDRVGLVVRWSDPSNHVLLEVSAAGATLYEQVGGAYAALAGPLTAASGDRWGLAVAGPAVTVTRNGTVVASATTALVVGNHLGLDSYNAAGTTARADNFAARSGAVGPEPYTALAKVVKVGHVFSGSEWSWRTKWSLVSS